MRSKLIVLIASLATVGAVVSSPAAAVEYANHVEVGGGGNHFGPFVYLFAAETFPYGTALGCAGIRSVGQDCATSVGETAIYEIPFDVESEPYIHNHSTWTSYFNGYYYK